MKVSTCSLDGILLIEPLVHVDARGFFLETYELAEYQKLGITEKFVQDNHSRSMKNVLRGLHYTKNRAQAQIVTVMRGRIFDVVVDIRKGSPTFGKWQGTELGDEGPRQVYMPHGFAHGFCVLSDYADLHYKVSQRYDPDDEAGLVWNDSDVKIDWPLKEPCVSQRDKSHSKLADIR